MKLPLVVLALCAIVSVAKAQLRPPNKADSGNAARLQPKELPSSSETCPPEDQRQAVRYQALQEVRSLLRNEIVPGLLCQIQNTQQLPADSCSALLAEGCISGYYWLNVTGGAARLYCDMDRVFLNSTEVWTRIAYLNMTDTTQNCPSGWREVVEPKRTCRRSLGSQSNSAIFRTYGMNYTRVCGRIIGYQLGTPEAFASYNNNQRQRTWTLDNYYMDGVSVTYGQPGSRMHIWSFAGAVSENHAGLNNCPCTNNRTIQDIAVPPFIGSDYFCETGTTSASRASTLFPNDPLWDGKGCGTYSSCCTFNNPPWFCKQLPAATTEDIEVRLLTAAGSANFESEDTPVELIELYIQ